MVVIHDDNESNDNDDNGVQGSSQPCHGAFTVKITGPPNMVTVNHATERSVYSKDY